MRVLNVQRCKKFDIIIISIFILEKDMIDEALVEVDAISMRLYGVILSFFFWLFSQRFLSFISADNKLIDRLINNPWTNQMNQYLRNRRTLCKYIFIFTSLLIDSSYVFMIYRTLFFNESRHYYLMICGLFFRQICQFFARMPHPQDVIWFDPGFPSLCVTYGVSNDYFFSGHTYCALVFGSMYMEMGYPGFAIFLVTTEISVIIFFKAHYFVDIYAATMTFLFLQHVM